MIIYSFSLIHEYSNFKHQVAIVLGTIAKIGMRGFLERLDMQSNIFVIDKKLCPSNFT